MTSDPPSPPLLEYHTGRRIDLPSLLWRQSPSAALRGFLSPLPLLFGFSLAMLLIDGYVVGARGTTISLAGGE